MISISIRYILVYNCINCVVSIQYMYISCIHTLVVKV